ncbi:MAG: hypothetical protein AAFU03_09235, partial [Bacteroidota bacterium]
LHIYRVEVDYILVKRSNNEVFGRDGKSYFTRTSTWGYAAEGRIWLAKGLLHTPWEYDAEYPNYKDEEVYKPVADSVFIYNSSGEVFPLAITDLDALDNDPSVGVRWGNHPAQSLQIDSAELSSRFIAVELKPTGEHRFQTNPKWLKITSIGGDQVPRVDDGDGPQGDYANLLLTIETTTSGFVLRVLGLFLGQSYPSDKNFLMAKTSTTAQSTVSAQPASSSSEDVEQGSNVGTTSGLTPISTEVPGITPVKVDSTTNAEGQIPGLDTPTTEENDRKNRRKNRRNQENKPPQG